MSARKRRAKKRPRFYFAIALPIALPLILASVSSQPDPKIAAAAMLTPRVSYDALVSGPAAQLPSHSEILTIENGDTLASVLTSGGLSARDAALLSRELSRSVDPRRLRPGTPVRFHRTGEGEIDSVQLKVPGWGDLEGIRGADGGFAVTPRPALQRQVESTVSATIDSSLYEALRNAGENPQLVQQLVDVFQWDIDFFRLRKGDSFTLVVEKKYAGTDLIGYGPILAARFHQGGGVYEAFRDEAHGGYYSRAGAPLRKQFLKAPLKFTRVTSGFSKRRYHPVLKYFRPHYGVDYGAPTGTPVMTTADGVVVEAAYSRGEGNVVRIRHTSRIETSYLHLSRFAKGMRRGAKVRQGEVIGYVGATGLATGPHLDYRVRDGGKWLDPLKLKSITPDPLRGEALTRFRANVARLVPRMQFPTEQLAYHTSPRRALF